MGSYRFNLFIPERQMEDFRVVSERTELPVAELMRRMFDRCLAEPVLNELVPIMSGGLALPERRG